MGSVRFRFPSRAKSGSGRGLDAPVRTAPRQGRGPDPGTPCVGAPILKAQGRKGGVGERKRERYNAPKRAEKSHLQQRGQVRHGE